MRAFSSKKTCPSRWWRILPVLTAPEGRRMGHAGAIISSAGESAAEKVETLKELGVIISPTPSLMGQTVAEVMAKL